MGRDGVEQHAPQAQVAVLPVHDYVEDDGLVNEVGQDACKCDEAPGLGIAKSEYQIGVPHYAPDILEIPAAAPPFGLIHPPKLLDVFAGEPVHELESGFDVDFSGHGAPLSNIPRSMLPA